MNELVGFKFGYCLSHAMPHFHLSTGMRIICEDAKHFAIHAAADFLKKRAVINA
jgi:hypothetical protein